MTDSQKIDLILDKVTSLDGRVASLDGRVASLEGRVTSLEEDMGSLKKDMNSLKFEVNRTNLMLENETNRNIKIVAEAHLDLTRKLEEAIKGSCEVRAKQEIHDIYINRHERMLNAL